MIAIPRTIRGDVPPLRAMPPGLSWSFVSALGLLLVTACSVADYQQPVDDMAGALDQSVASIDQLDQRMTAARNSQWEQDIVDGKALLTTADDSCSAGKTTCALEILHRGGDAPKPYPATSIIPKAKAGLAGLKLYVANLKSIVGADTVNQVTTSANAALGSLANIQAVAKGEANAASSVIAAYSEPTLGAINWLVGQYVDYVKFRALRQATNEAQPVIEELAGFYDTIAQVAATFDLGGATSDFAAAQRAFSSSKPPSAQAIDKFVAAAQRYDQVLRATSARPLKAFADAHGKLAAQLNGDISLSDALAAIENLVARAKAFEAIVDGFEKVADSQ